MLAKSLMIQGTTSDAGKSTIALGICRLLRRLGKKVAPFKPQNMALNSAVTIDGGEIGRAQALQAVACGVEAHTDMNPVLLKPCTNSLAQVIIHGKVWKDLDARGYHAEKPAVMPYVLESFQRLSKEYECLVVEGAGSPAEINLRANDIANMGFATAADVPVLLVADIDRGGVFAHLYGTYELLQPEEQRRIIGFLINKFRGDPSLLAAGNEWLQEKTGKPVLGVVPYLPGLVLDAEDSLSGRNRRATATGAGLQVVVIDLPRFSNRTDFEPLAADPQVEVTFAVTAADAPPCDLLIIPGSKTVVADLQWLLERGWEQYILRHLRYGGRLLGICGGFQMLGQAILDPHGVESGLAEMPGLGLLDMSTTLERQKTLARSAGRLVCLDNAHVEGYEIHMGVSSGASLASPAVDLDGRSDGCVSAGGNIIGTYMHGLFDSADARAAIYKWCGFKPDRVVDFYGQREDSIDQVADALEANADWAYIRSFFTS